MEDAPPTLDIYLGRMRMLDDVAEEETRICTYRYLSQTA